MNKDSYWTWLRFFAVVLIVVSPLGAVEDMISIWKSFPPEIFRKVWEAYPLYTFSILLISLGSIFLTAYGLKVGFILWNKASTGKSEAQKYLILRLGINYILILFSVIIVETSLAPEDRQSNFSNFGETVVQPLFSETVFFTVWWLYFVKSKLVKSIYG
jgi:hypothetical protein